MKNWEKILLYPIGLYIWLTDGIKKMSKKWKPAMAMLMAVVMLCGMLPATAMAASAAKVNVGGISLADGQCLTSNEATAATTWAEGDDYVALYKDGVLYINNLEISGEGAAISFQGSKDLIIDVSGENTLVRTDGTCIDITSHTYDLVIQGSGTLTATGSSFGIWVWENVTIQGNVTLTVEGTSDAGIASNRGNTGLSDTSITIKDNAFVTAIGGKHGLGGDHDRTPRVVVEGNATVVAKGGTYAIRKLTADTVSSQRVRASTDITGSNKEEYVAENNTTYKYVAVNYGTGIAYLDSNGAKQYCDEYTSVDGSTTWNAGWYYVGSDITISDRITVTGDVHLILGDGCTLTASGGIAVTSGNSLTVYAQSTGDNMGKLNSTGKRSAVTAGIGGNDRTAAGNITINGGFITATGSVRSAGIGGSDNGNVGNITINGGFVTATGGEDSAGIGNGYFGTGGNITINGGTITAAGGKSGAGIGGGFNSAVSSITINGGTITTTGGKSGAGIGGGDYVGSENIVINGGTITATGGEDAAGIGGGYHGTGGNITINGGNVTATGGNQGAGIGGGWYGKGGVITIGNATVQATGVGNEAQDIGCGEDYFLPYPSYEITFDANGGTGTMYRVYVTKRMEYTLPESGFTAPESKSLVAWSIDGVLYQPGEKITISKDITVTALWGALHTCTAGTEWESDGDNHWHICTDADCGTVIDGSEAAHTSTGANVATCQKKAVCDVCGVTYGVFTGHDWNTAFEKDATGHWYKCSTVGCTEKKDFAEHKPDRTGGATEEYAVKCTDCGWIIEQQLGHTHAFDKEVVAEKYLASGANCNDPAKYYKSCQCGEKGTETFTSGTANGHTAGAEWKSDKDNHWHICTVAGCGAVIDSSKTAHTPDRAAATETDPIKCSVCGCEIAPALGHTHAHGTTWKSDADNHWNECACGDKANTAAHKDENKDGKCDVCEYNKYTVTYKADGKVVKTVEVEHGKDATAPEIPAKAGHTAAWDKDGKNITADTVINAVYTINKYTVTYKADGKVVKTVEVEHGNDATAPEIPAKEGYNETAPKWDKDGKNITADTEINAVYTKNQPGTFTSITPTTNAGGGKITDQVHKLKEKIPFTQEEALQIECGADVEVWLEVEDISASVPADDKKEIEKKLGDGNVALYLDIAMFKQVGENEASRLTQLSDKVQITFQLPDSYINTDQNVTRTYSIIHVHDGKAEVIIPVFDAATKTLTFETDRFSTYGVVYTDEKITPPAQETTAPTEATKPASKVPETGDSFQPVFWIACMILSIFGIAVLLLDAKRRHAR